MSIGPCTEPSITPGVVTFNPVAFKEYYPEFAAVALTALQTNFTRATLILSNCCGSLVCDAPTRQVLLGMLVAHITALNQGAWGQPPQGVVGRVSDATEGSVSVSLDYAATTSQTIAWLNQTKYGAEFVASTTQYRTARYIAPCDAYGGYGLGYSGWNAWPQ